MGLALHRLRDFLPAGVCDPPNPMIYRQLANLCSDEAERLERDPGIEALHGTPIRIPEGHCPPLCPMPDYSNPDQPYEWDEPCRLSE